MSGEAPKGNVEQNIEPDNPKRRAVPILAVSLLVVVFGGLVEGVSYVAIRYQEHFRDVVAPPTSLNESFGVKPLEWGCSPGGVSGLLPCGLRKSE